MKYKTILEALESERPNDKIIKTLSNKFAIVQSVYENGTYEDCHSIAGLDNGTIYFYGKTYKGQFTQLKEWVIDRLNSLHNTQMQRIGYYPNDFGTPTERFKIQDNRKYKRVHRKLLSLI